jgi:hypothetical protein
LKGKQAIFSGVAERLCSTFFGECRALMASIKASFLESEFKGELLLYKAMLLFCGSKEIGLCTFSLFFAFYGLATSGSGDSSLI